MFPLWDVAISPVIVAAGAKKVLEIGAFRGETTVRMLENLGPDSEVHVIDPVPAFDPAVHEQDFPGRYLFYRDLSHNVLPTLPAMDVALVDGDHNWFTVYHELRMLADGARRDGAPLPVLILHDVGWPYGRRDLYYDPETVPEEFRQPYRQGGMRMGRSALVNNGGLNPTMYNAEHEGGERNGVMTALDDFMATYDRPLRMVVLPIYFGLAIVVEQARLDARPELAAALDHLEDATGRGELLHVAEEVHLRAMTFHHHMMLHRERQLTRVQQRYLATVKSALLDEHYLEHEARILMLTKAVRTGAPPEAPALRDPTRYDKEQYPKLVRARTSPAGPDEQAETSFLPYTAIGRARLEHLERCLDTIRSESVPGDLADCGVGRGGTSVFLRAYVEGFELPDRDVWVVDRFRVDSRSGDQTAPAARRRARVPRRPPPRARRVLPLRPARRARPLPPGPARRHARRRDRPRRRDAPARAASHRPPARCRCPHRPRPLLRPPRARRFRRGRGCAGPGACQGARCVPGRAGDRGTRRTRRRNHARVAQGCRGSGRARSCRHRPGPTRHWRHRNPATRPI